MKILVIEDKDNHQKDAKKCLKTRFKNIITDFATTYNDALEMLKNSTYDGILSDIFLPLEEEKNIKSIMSHLKDGGGFIGGKITLEKYKNFFKNEWPYGVLIGHHALSKSLPIVLITDTNHHGKKTEPVNAWGKSKNIPMVDRDVNEKNCKEEGLDYRNDIEKAVQHTFREKDWLRGFFTILWMITGKNRKIVNITTGIKTEVPFERYNSFLNCMRKKDWSSYSDQKESVELFVETANKYLKHCP